MKPVLDGGHVYLAKPRKQVREDGSEKEQYSILIPLKKTDPATKLFMQQLLKMVEAASLEKHGKAILPKHMKNFPVKDGDTDPNLSDKENFIGHWCINAKANFRPSVVSASGEPLSTEDDIYSGAWYKAKLSIFAWNHKTGGKGVSINIESAIKKRDDGKFGGGSDAADDFADEVDPNAPTGGEEAAAGEDNYGL